MVGGELVLGYLAAWFIRKAQRAGRRLDTEADRVLDLALDNLHELITARLGNESALQRADEETQGNGSITDRTRLRIKLALDEMIDTARVSDAAFIVVIEAAIARIEGACNAAGTQEPIDPSPNAVNLQARQIGGIVRDVTADGRGNAVGNVAGSLTINQSGNLTETCVCGREAAGICKICTQLLCEAHIASSQLSTPGSMLPTVQMTLGKLRAHLRYFVLCDSCINRVEADLFDRMEVEWLPNDQDPLACLTKLADRVYWSSRCSRKQWENAVFKVGLQLRTGISGIFDLVAKTILERDQLTRLPGHKGYPDLFGVLVGQEAFFQPSAPYDIVNPTGKMVVVTAEKRWLFAWPAGRKGRYTAQPFSELQTARTDWCGAIAVPALAGFVRYSIPTEFPVDEWSPLDFSGKVDEDALRAVLIHHHLA